MYSAWSVKQLKDELKTRGGSLRGRKADLVSRLEAFDRNSNFGITQDHETDDIKMDVPSPDNFRDINSSTALPVLNKQHIQLYFEEHNKRPDEALRLYESRFLIALRAAVSGEYTFVKSICKASMKRLQYESNLKLHKSGTIEETTCECVAGSGVMAHCKHVAVALYGVEHMVREKKIIKYESPTEKLQRFHAPTSVFTSSPLKTSGLPSKRNIDSSIFSPCYMDINKDEYNKKFRSLITNYTSSSMAFKQLTEPANPYAVENDHNYIGVSPEQDIMLTLNLNFISPSTAAQIELETRGQSANPAWCKHREVRLTASRFHTICHLRDCNQEKFADQLLDQRKFTSKATNHGIINETVALQKYMEEIDLQVEQCGMFISRERPYLAASPDGLLGEETVIEIKCPYATRHSEITPITVPYLVRGVNGNLDLKKSSPYYYQVQGQLYCTGRQFCNFIVFTFQDMVVIFIDRDNDFINEMLVRLDNFYEVYFKKALLNKYYYKNYLNLIKKQVV